LPMGSIESPHPRLKFKSVLEKSFYTFAPLRGNKSLSGYGAIKNSAVSSRTGSNLVPLPPDVAEPLPDNRSFNSALRGLIRVAKRQLRRTH